jgi:hypothetical protein
MAKEAACARDNVDGHHLDVAIFNGLFKHVTDSALNLNALEACCDSAVVLKTKTERLTSNGMLYQQIL